MELFTPDQQAQLLANGAASAVAILKDRDPPDPFLFVAMSESKIATDFLAIAPVPSSSCSHPMPGRPGC